MSKDKPPQDNSNKSSPNKKPLTFAFNNKFDNKKLVKSVLEISIDPILEKEKKKKNEEKPNT